MTDTYRGTLTLEQQTAITQLHGADKSGRGIAQELGIPYGKVRGFLEWFLDDPYVFPDRIKIQDPASLGLVPPPASGPAVLVYDIESTPTGAWVWSPYKTNIIGVMEGHDWYLLSFAYKWLGQKGMHFVSIWQDPQFKPHSTDDRFVTERLASLLDAADVVMAHNGDSFDQKKANSRISLLGIDPPSPYREIDTLKESRRYFKHFQNSLKELGRLYTTEMKMQNEGIELWLGCMAGDPEKHIIMEKYNRQDVNVLERLYYRFLPWIGSPGKMSPNAGHWARGVLACSKLGCGSTDVQRRGHHRTAVSDFQTIQCNQCGGYSRIRESIKRYADDKIVTL